MLLGVSSARNESTGLAAPDSRDPLYCPTTSSSEPPEMRLGPCFGIQSRSPTGVARLLGGDPDSGTSLSIKSNTAPSETAEHVEVGPRTILFSENDKKVFFHFFAAERSARATTS